MPRKLTYNEVKSYIEKKTNGKCKLVSTDYINSGTKMEFICECGNHFIRTFAKMKTRNSFKCNNCVGKEVSKIFRKDINDVINYIKSKECEYISGEYINHSSPLTIKCKCGNIFIKDFNHFKRGQNRCPQCGNKSLKEKKMKYNIDIAREIFKKSGYTLLSTKYISCEEPLECKCPRGHLTKISLSYFMANNSGCRKCANDNLKGANHWNYKGGESEVIDFFRKHIKQWKKDVLYKYNYKCILTNSRGDIVIHHLKSFSDIVKESCDELHLPLQRRIKDYSKEDFEKLSNLIISKHNANNGVTLQRKIHNRFHALYGKGGNTKEQFIEFVKIYYPKEYDRIYQLLQ